MKACSLEVRKVAGGWRACDFNQREGEGVSAWIGFLLLVKLAFQPCTCNFANIQATLRVAVSSHFCPVILDPQPSSPDLFLHSSLIGVKVEEEHA